MTIEDIIKKHNMDDLEPDTELQVCGPKNETVFLHGWFTVSELIKTASILCECQETGAEYAGD